MNLHQDRIAHYSLQLKARARSLTLQAKHEKLASQARHESVARQELFASRTVVWIIVKNLDSSCLNRVSHRVIFRRNRALSCYIVLKIRNPFFNHFILAPRSLEGSSLHDPGFDFISLCGNNSP